MPDGPSIIALSVGNTRTQIGLFVEGELTMQERFPNGDLPAAVERVVALWPQIREQPQAAIVMASVNDSIARQLRSMVRDQLSLEVYEIGDDLPPPIGTQLDPETMTGVDRLLNAAAAYDTLKQACIIIDAGTAVTVDFVDGHGTFHGGAIGPGARMQIRALHEHTAALPEVEFRAPQSEPFGRSTAQAMLQGVYHGIRGMAWKLVERYAEGYGAFPTVIATGGDAQVLFGDDELVDRIVPELTLLGIAVAARHALAGRGGGGTEQ
jgi:type III pantothenate kinase